MTTNGLTGLGNVGQRDARQEATASTERLTALLCAARAWADDVDGNAKGDNVRLTRDLFRHILEFRRHERTLRSRPVTCAIVRRSGPDLRQENVCGGPAVRTMGDRGEGVCAPCFTAMANSGCDFSETELEAMYPKIKEA